MPLLAFFRQSFANRKTAEVYLSFSIADVQKAKAILTANKIPFIQKQKNYVPNHQRSFAEQFGYAMDNSVLYYLRVRQADAEHAQYLLHKYNHSQT